MNNIKISIIIPVYNVEKYLRQCLDSVCNQTLKDIEIICIDDYSTDNSLQILKEYQQKYSNIKIIARQNEGCYVARNIGLDNANGEYIGFVDSDDYVKQDMYEQLYSKAVQTNADIVSCDYFSFFEKTNILKEIKFSSSIKLLENSKNKLIGAEDILLDNSVIWNKIYRRKMLIENNIKFNFDIKMADDNYFNRISLLNAKKIVYIPLALYTYRIHRKGAITNSNNEKNLDCIKVSNNIINYVNNNNFKHFMPWINRICIRLIFLGYTRLDKEFKDNYFNEICNFLDKNSIKSIKQIEFHSKRQFNIFELYYYKNILSTISDFITIKLIINKNKFMLDLIVNIKQLIKKLLKL